MFAGESKHLTIMTQEQIPLCKAYSTIVSLAGFIRASFAPRHFSVYNVYVYFPVIWLTLYRGTTRTYVESSDRLVSIAYAGRLDFPPQRELYLCRKFLLGFFAGKFLSNLTSTTTRLS